MKRLRNSSFAALAAILAALVLASPLFFSANSPVLAQPASYDLVIKGGRVIDPSTGLDAVRNVGVVAGTIAAISPQEKKGKQ